jgi:hypothetical protein
VRKVPNVTRVSRDARAVVAALLALNRLARPACSRRQA